MKKRPRFRPRFGLLQTRTKISHHIANPVKPFPVPQIFMTRLSPLLSISITLPIQYPVENLENNLEKYTFQYNGPLTAL